MTPYITNPVGPRIDHPALLSHGGRTVWPDLLLVRLTTMCTLSRTGVNDPILHTLIYCRLYNRRENRVSE